eukprot:3631655-Pyramimonas_sp.AAC.1
MRRGSPEGRGRDLREIERLGPRRWLLESLSDNVCGLVVRWAVYQGHCSSGKLLRNCGSVDP